MPKLIEFKTAPESLGGTEWTTGGTSVMINPKAIVAIEERSDAPDGTKRCEIVLTNRVGVVVAKTIEQALEKIRNG